MWLYYQCRFFFLKAVVWQEFYIKYWFSDFPFRYIVFPWHNFQTAILNRGQKLDKLFHVKRSTYKESLISAKIMFYLIKQMFECNYWSDVLLWQKRSSFNLTQYMISENVFFKISEHFGENTYWRNLCCM